MMFVRLLPNSKEKLLIIFISLILVVSAIYLFLNYLQEKKSVRSSGERCMSELNSLKYQINEVTEYKNRIDQLLTETQAAHKAEKEKLKDIMESCVALKQQATTCQNQFEDLQGECKKVRNDYNQLRKQQNLKT